MLIHFRNYLGLSKKGNLSLCRENFKGAFYHHLYKGVIVSQSDIHWVKTFQRYSGVTLLDVNYHLKHFIPLILLSSRMNGNQDVSKKSYPLCQPSLSQEQVQILIQVMSQVIKTRQELSIKDKALISLFTTKASERIKLTASS